MAEIKNAIIKMQLCVPAGLNRYEAISKLGFWLKVKTGPSFNPQALLKYVEDLKRAPNTETCPPLADWAKRLF